MALAAVVLALAVGLVGSRSLDGASAAPRAESSAKVSDLPTRLLLRLHDLPLGYRLLNFGLIENPLLTFGCAGIEPAEPRPRLASFLQQYQPSGCAAIYLRLFRTPGSGPTPVLVASGAAELGSVEGAEAALSVSRELLAHLNDDELPEEVQPPATVGEQTRLFHWREGGIDPEEGISILVWRSGASVGAVLTTVKGAGFNDAAAVEFARRQQSHLEAPTPYLPSEYDDLEVPLEDPALQVPVYWLGRVFAPGRGLARLKLAESASNTRPNSRHSRVTLLYADRPSFNDAEAVELDLWTPRQWQARRSQQFPLELHCATTRPLDLARGRAVLYAGIHPGWRCRERRRAPKVHAVVVRFRGVVVIASTLSICANCTGAADGPYNSLRGMAAVARGLERRLQPVAR